MLHAKFQDHRTSGSGEDFCFVLFVLRLNFSVMSGRSHRFLGN